MEYRIGTEVFGGWKIIRELGEGANGKVFEIQKDAYGVTTSSALKVIRVPRSVSDIKAALNEGMDEQSVTTYFEGFVEEIIKEIALMTELKSHPNIVGYEDHDVVPHSGEIGWDILIRMELLTTVSDWQRTHQITEEDILRMGIDLCRALVFCQKKGMIHRDIKPENIFVSTTGQFKLGDFGVARTIEKTTGGLSKKGTESYMAPEVYLGRSYGVSVDIYSLGLVLYKFCNENRLPFFPPLPKMITFADRENALSKRMSGEPLPAPRQASTALTEVILKACAYNLKERYRTAAEMLEALEQIKKPDSRSDKQDTSEPVIVTGEIEEEQTIGMDLGFPEEKTIGMKEELPEEKTIGMDFDVSEEKTVGMNMEMPADEEEKTIGLETVISPASSNSYVHTAASEKKKTEYREIRNNFSRLDELEAPVPDPEPAERKKKKIVAGIIIGGASVALGIMVWQMMIPKYELTVNGGSGSDMYRAGSYVTVTADKPPKSEAKDVAQTAFAKWETAWDGAFDRTSSSTGFEMPKENLTLSAIYEPVYQLEFTCSVDADDIWIHRENYYFAGTEVPLNAIAQTASGLEFYYWDIEVRQYSTETTSDYGDEVFWPVEIADIYSPETVLVMPEITDDSVSNYYISTEARYYDAYGKEWAAVLMNISDFLTADTSLFMAPLEEIQTIWEDSGYTGLSEMNEESLYINHWYKVIDTDANTVTNVSSDKAYRLSVYSNDDSERSFSVSTYQPGTDEPCPVLLPSGIELGDSRDSVLSKLQISNEAYIAARSNSMTGPHISFYEYDEDRGSSMNFHCQSKEHGGFYVELSFDAADILTEFRLYGCHYDPAAN